MPVAMSRKKEQQYRKRKSKKIKQKRQKKKQNRKDYYKNRPSQYYIDLFKKHKKTIHAKGKQASKMAYSKGKRAVKDAMILSEGKYYCTKCKKYHRLGKSKVGRSHYKYRK